MTDSAEVVRVRSLSDADAELIDASQTLLAELGVPCPHVRYRRTDLRDATGFFMDTCLFCGAARSTTDWEPA